MRAIRRALRHLTASLAIQSGQYSRNDITKAFPGVIFFVRVISAVHLKSLLKSGWFV
jgi:hypothetical protein